MTFLRAISWTHPLIASALFIAFALVGYPMLGAAIPVALYWGREQRDAENVTGKSSAATILPLSWPVGQQADFWPVVAVCAALYTVWSIL